MIRPESSDPYTWPASMRQSLDAAMSPAATIRRAAALMRERAVPMDNLAPWTHEHGMVYHSGGNPIAGRMGMKAGEHIASWHPAVALAVADWLDDIDARADGRVDFRRPNSADLAAALAVARAYLAEVPA